ncbi:hypothetical protein J3D46_003582 [Paenarthrobacter sp. A20]|nr:hypothetical protein [Paenarthrobacter sp. A20]
MATDAVLADRAGYQGRQHECPHLFDP